MGAFTKYWTSTYTEVIPHFLRAGLGTSLQISSTPEADFTILHHICKIFDGQQTSAGFVGWTAPVAPCGVIIVRTERALRSIPQLYDWQSES
jgi:hypothetical protein